MMTKNVRGPSQIIEHFYLNRDRSGDVTFLVDSQRIRAHRFILAAVSPKYKAQFYGLHPDQGEIRVANVSAAAFNVFLQFFYKKTVDLTMENIGAVMDLAQQSLVDEFVDGCANFLMKAIMDNKLCIPYRLANLYGIESLCLECEHRISTKTTEVFASDDFLQWDREMLLFILKMDALNCTEKYLFYACIAWGRAQCERNNLDEEKLGNLREVLGDVIYQIRFSSFNAEEFAILHRSFEGFFRTAEFNELLYMTNKLKNFKPKLFNPTLRTLGCEPKTRTVAWSRQFDRFESLKKLTEKIIVFGRSSFSLTSTKPIRLHGFALGMHFKNTNPFDFPMNVSLDVERSVVPKFKVQPSATRKNETTFIFDKPIEKVTKFSCSITLPFKQLSYEFVLKSTDRILVGREELTRFEFGGDKWFTRIFFDI